MHPRGATASPPTPTLGRGRASEAGLGWILALGVLALAAPAAAQDLTQPSRELSDLESDAQRLMSQRVQAHDVKRDTFVEERLTDGEPPCRAHGAARRSRRGSVPPPGRVPGPADGFAARVVFLKLFGNKVKRKKG